MTGTEKTVLKSIKKLFGDLMDLIPDPYPPISATDD